MKEALLRIRKKIKSKKPSFRRQESHRKKLPENWRRPRGRFSKMRKQKKSRPGRPRTGYGSPKAVRGMNSHGYREIIVQRPSDLDGMKPGEEVAVISSSVGRKKRFEIINRADEKGLKVVNSGIRKK